MPWAKAQRVKASEQVKMICCGNPNCFRGDGCYTAG